MTLVENFVTKVIEESSFEELDRIYLTNRVLALVGDGVLEVEIDQDDLIELKRSACRGSRSIGNN